MVRSEIILYKRITTHGRSLILPCSSLLIKGRGIRDVDTTSRFHKISPFHHSLATYNFTIPPPFSFVESHTYPFTNLAFYLLKIFKAFSLQKNMYTEKPVTN